MDLSLASAKTSSLNRGYAIGLTGIFLWSWTGIFISYLLRHFSLLPMTLAFWRDVFVVITLVLAFVVVRRSALAAEAGQRRFLLLYGVSLTLMNVLWTWSVALNGAAVSTVLVYASPGITALAARYFFKEQLSAVRLAAFAASLIGCVLVARATDPAQWDLNAAGILIGVLSAFGFTFYSMMGKATAHRRINSWTATLWAFAVAVVALLPIALISIETARVAQPPIEPARLSLLSLGAQWDGWLILIVLAVIPTVGGFGLYTASLAHLPAGTANLLATLEPVLTTLWAYLLLGESLDDGQLLGAALIFASVIALRLEDKR